MMYRFRLLNANERLRMGHQANVTMDTACQVGIVHGNNGSIMDWGVFSWRCLRSLVRLPTSLKVICVKGYHTVPTNLTELWTTLANTWQVIPLERFQKLVESMLFRVSTVIKARRGPNRY
ncbi:uncharacterized protein TNCV_473921 [Trichonephila clavipes]|nr:uncharacterized protein TNCV_473921 [Trichonephila clavipes]